VPGSDLPDKLFFKIGEVAQIVGVRAHVLRYWESEFVSLRPMKTRGAHRVYRRRDVELAVLLRRLLHDEGLTIAGAKRRLRETGHHRVNTPAEASVVSEVNTRSELLAMRAELAELLQQLRTLLDGPPASESLSSVHATVTASVPNSVPVQSGRRPPSV
jgi:DNA-binding transcriptional MerR regulator